MTLECPCCHEDCVFNFCHKCGRYFKLEDANLLKQRKTVLKQRKTEQGIEIRNISDNENTGRKLDIL